MEQRSWSSLVFTMIELTNSPSRAQEMALQVNLLAAMPDNLSPTPGIHMTKSLAHQERSITSYPVTSTHVPWHMETDRYI